MLLKGYQSPSSGSVSKRMVEPFQFMRNNAEVRCYEPASGMNKTFKVMRTREVVVLDLLWEHKDEHRAFKTDLFHFSGEETKPVKLALGPLATSLLIEEFPGAEQQLKQMRGGKQLLETEVCNFKGVGRFVMGLYDDIEVLGCKEFQEYINERIAITHQPITTRGPAIAAGPLCAACAVASSGMCATLHTSHAATGLHTRITVTV